MLIIASWSNRQQHDVIEYLRTENAVLKEKFGKKRILLTDDQRRRLAVKGKQLGRKLLGRKQLEQLGTLFTPDTILRWHRQLVANEMDRDATFSQSFRDFLARVGRNQRQLFSLDQFLDDRTRDRVTANSTVPRNI